MTQQCFNTDADSEGNTNSGSAIGFTFLTGSEYIGSSLTQVTFYLKRLSAGSSTDLSCTIYDSSGTLQATSTNTIASSTLSTSDFTECVFTISHTLAAGDRIMVFNGSSGTFTLRPQQSCSMTGTENPALQEYQGGSWNSPNQNCQIHSCITYSGSVGGTGTLLPPPVAWI
jgi:hypothetical protein